MHKFHRCSHSPTWSTRSHAAALAAPLFPPFSPFRVRLRKGHAIPPLRCKLLSAFYTSRNRIWVNSAKIEIPSSPLPLRRQEDQGQDRGLPPISRRNACVTVHPRNRGGRARRRLPRKSKCQPAYSWIASLPALFLPSSSPRK